MTAPAAKPSAIVIAARALKLLAERFVDVGDVTSRRLAKIEDRLAKLDDGEDAAAAQRAALFDVIGERVEAGKSAPDLTIVDGVVTWRSRR